MRKATLHEMKYSHQQIKPLTAWDGVTKLPKTQIHVKQHGLWRWDTILRI